MQGFHPFSPYSSTFSKLTHCCKIYMKQVKSHILILWPIFNNSKGCVPPLNKKTSFNFNSTLLAHTKMRKQHVTGWNLQYLGIYVCSFKLFIHLMRYSH